jgi:hypothetical protein
MTWVQWMTARRLLYEEHMGRHLRAGVNAKSAEYARSAALLRKHGAVQES